MQHNNYDLFKCYDRDFLSAHLLYYNGKYYDCCEGIYELKGSLDYSNSELESKSIVEDQLEKFFDKIEFCFNLNDVVEIDQESLILYDEAEVCSIYLHLHKYLFIKKEAKENPEKQLLKINKAIWDSNYEIKKHKDRLQDLLSLKSQVENTLYLKLENNNDDM